MTRNTPGTAPGSRSLEELCPSRRSVLRAATALGVVLAPGLLAGCSDSGGGAGGGATTGARVPVSEVPVGQARVVEAGGSRVVVAQPTEGDFVAFSAQCTHQGATVEAEEGTVLLCPLHGSRFDAGDGGAVVNGPATRALPEVEVSVDGEELVLG